MRLTFTSRGSMYRRLIKARNLCNMMTAHNRRSTFRDFCRKSLLKIGLIVEEEINKPIYNRVSWVGRAHNKELRIGWNFSQCFWRETGNLQGQDQEPSHQSHTFHLHRQTRVFIKYQINLNQTQRLEEMLRKMVQVSRRAYMLSRKTLPISEILGIQICHFLVHRHLILTWLKMMSAL